MDKLKERIQALIAQSMDSFQRLNERDRTVVLGAAVVVATLSIVGTTYSLLNSIDKAARQVSHKSEQLREIIALRETFKRAQDKNAAFRARLTGNDLRLISLIEEEAKKLNIEVGNVSPHADAEPNPSGIRTQQIDLRAQKLSYDRLSNFLQKLEEQAKPVRVIRLKITTRYDEKDLIDAEMTVATYKAS